MRRSLAVVTGMIVLVLLTGCASDAPRSVPLSAVSRVRLYEKRSAAEWRTIADEESLATPRPDLRVQNVSTGSQWVLNIAGCLREQGAPDFTVTPGGVITLTGADAGSAGQLPIFVCEAQHPRTEDLAKLLSDSQLGSLYDYYIDSLQPCLLINAGEPVRDAPSRVVFIRDYYTNPWSPNDASVRSLYVRGRDGRLRLDALGTRCPPFPSWLPAQG